MTENNKSCAVAFPSKRNAQLSPLECATGSATPAQPNSLKAASLRILERNKARNTCATETEKTAQLWGEKTGPKVARVAQHSSDEIHQAVLLMAEHWQYTPDDLAYVLTDSASDPQGWLPILYAEGWLVKPTETTRATP